MNQVDLLDLQLKDNLTWFEHFMQDPINHDLAPVKVLSKLKLMQLSLKDPNAQIRPSEFPEFKEDEIINITKLPHQAKADIFNNVIATVYQQTKIQQQVFILGSSGLFWNLKMIEVDLVYKKLRINRKSQKKEPHIIELKGYSATKLGKRKDKLTIQLSALSTAAKRKEILIGADTQKEIDTLYTHFERCCKSPEENRNHTGSMVQHVDRNQMLNSIILSKSQFDISNESCSLVVEYPPLFLKSLQEKVSLEYLANEEVFTTIQFKGSTRILQSKTDKDVFKVFVSLPPYSELDILHYLNDPELRQQWDYSSAQYEILCVPCNDTYLIRDVKRQRHCLEKVRTFEFLRYINTQVGQTYILEKSTVGLSRMHWGVYALYQTQESCFLIHEFKINHLGFGDQTNLRFNISYMQQFEHLKNLLKSQFKLNQLLKQHKQIQGQRKGSQMLVEEVNPNKDLSLKELLKLAEENKHFAMAIHEYNLKIKESYKPPVKLMNNNGTHFFFKEDWEVDDKRGVLKFINKKKLQLQKDVFSFILKKIGSNLISGKSVLNISLPIYIFEKRSNLERVAFGLTYAPEFLEKAAQQKDPVEQMKLVIQMAISCPIRELNLEKPFNPILGETFQGWIKGCPVFCEQVSHHPPICAFQYYGRGYYVHGHYELQASMYPNKVIGRNFGYCQVDFQETGNSIQFNMCNGCLMGITFGDRLFNLEGLAWFVDVKSNVVGDLFMNPSTGFLGKRQRMDHFEGGVYKVDNAEIERFKRLTYRSYNGIRGMAGQPQKVADVNGTWWKEIHIDGQEVFNLEKTQPYDLEYEEFPLASDGKYRQDLIAWRMDDFDLGMAKKELLENIQRADRKLREKIGPKKQH